MNEKINYECNEWIMKQRNNKKVITNEFIHFIICSFTVDINVQESSKMNKWSQNEWDKQMNEQKSKQFI